MSPGAAAAVVHGPGQAAVYSIVNLGARAWSPGEFHRRLQRGLIDALGELRVTAVTRPGRMGLWSRTGLIAALGVCVRREAAVGGAFLNVIPQPGLTGYVDCSPDPAAPPQRSTMTSLVTERGRPARMATVRAALVARLAAALDCSRPHLFTGHPLLRRATPNRESNAATG